MTHKETILNLIKVFKRKKNKEAATQIELRERWRQSDRWWNRLLFPSYFDYIEKAITQSISRQADNYTILTYLQEYYRKTYEQKNDNV